MKQELAADHFPQCSKAYRVKTLLRLKFMENIQTKYRICTNVEAHSSVPHRAAEKRFYSLSLMSLRCIYFVALDAIYSS